MALIPKKLEDDLHELMRGINQMNIYLKCIAECQVKMTTMQEKYYNLFNKEDNNEQDDRK